MKAAVTLAQPAVRRKPGYGEPWQRGRDAHVTGPVSGVGTLAPAALAQPAATGRTLPRGAAAGQGPGGTPARMPGHDFGRMRVHAETVAPPARPAARLHVGAADEEAEREAEQAADAVMAGRAAQVQPRGPGVLRRRVVAAAPADPVPELREDGTQAPARGRTHAEVLESYLRQLSASGSPSVDRGSGEVTLASGFCRRRGFFGRLGRGIGQGAATGARIGAYFLGVGALPGAILGGLIGGIAGLFGSDSQAEESSTPTGSTCLCDMVQSSNTWRIHLHDFMAPLVVSGGRVTQPVTSGLDRQQRTGFIVVPTPRSPRLFGATTVSGRLENTEPWLVLGHELCGHAWLQDRRRAGDDEEGIVEGEDLRHHRTVERENLLRAEHGLEARGFRLRDPYCGESFVRDRSAPAAAPHFGRADRQAPIDAGPGHEADRTSLDECQAAREQFLPEQARRYRVSERIP